MRHFEVFIRWFFSLTIGSGPELQVLASVFHKSGTFQLPQEWEKCGHSGSFPSLSSAVSSLNMLYTHWKERKPCRSVLKDFALGEDPELFFKRCPGGEFADDYGLNCTVESWSPVSHSSGDDAGTRTLRKRSLRRSTSSRLKKARTGTSQTMEGSLVPSEPRVGLCPLRLSGRGVELVQSSGVDPGGTVESPGSLHGFCSVLFKSGNRD